MKPRKSSARRPAWVLAALSALLFVSGSSGCTRAVEPRGGTPAGDSAVPQALEQQRREYIKASIEIGCLTRRETDPQKVAAGTMLIYRHHGFEDVMSYLALVEKLGPDKGVQLELAEGLKNCP